MFYPWSSQDGSCKKRRISGIAELRSLPEQDETRQTLIQLQNERPADKNEELLWLEQKLQPLVRLVYSNSGDLQERATYYIRLLVSIDCVDCFPVDVLIKLGLVRLLVEFLGWEMRPRIQFEAAWVLTNIVAGTTEQTLEVIRHHATEKFVALLKDSPVDHVREQAIWALANIAGDCYICRFDLFVCDPVVPLWEKIDRHSSLTVVKIASWALSNFCQSEPALQLGEADLQHTGLAADYAPPPDLYKDTHRITIELCIEPLCVLLCNHDYEVDKFCLEGLENILKVGEAEKQKGKNNGINIYVELIDEQGGWYSISKLQGCWHIEVASLAGRIWNTYWCQGHGGSGGIQPDFVSGSGSHSTDHPESLSSSTEDAY